MSDSAGAEVLVADDDPRLRELVRYTLVRAGYVVREAADGRAALAAIAQREPDLVVLDVLMPELDGLSACREMRERGIAVPVIFLSTRSEEVDRIVGLDLGGDDYLPKPFAPNELVSRVRAVLRRARPKGADGEPNVNLDGVEVDLQRFEARAASGPLPLTRTELRMLHALLAAGGNVVSRGQLIRAAYDGPHFVSERTVDSHMRGVRTKLRAASVDRVDTVNGVGWRWRAG